MYMTDSIEKRLRGKLADSNIVLFLGAGINRPAAPAWESLLEKIIEHAVYYALGDKWTSTECQSTCEWIRNGLSVYEQASFAKRLLGKQYLHTIHQELYRPVDSTFPVKGNNARYLQAIAELCQKKNIVSVVTYNYDDFLECLLRSRKRDFVSISGCDMTVHGLLARRASKLPIYHVHGFLPRDGNMADFDESGFVLCYEEYYRTLLEPYSWQNVQQLALLRTCTPVYLGISLRDMDMIRLLHHAGSYASKAGGYILWCEKDITGNYKFNKRVEAVRESLCEVSGLEMILCGPTYEDIYAVVEKLAAG